MPVYTITFELNGEGGKRDYAGLVEELKKQRCHPVLRNHWLGSFKNSAVQVQNHFRKLIGKTDRIMVAELFRHYAYANSLPNCSKWLELNPPADQAASAPVGAKPRAMPAPKAKPAPKPAAKPAAKARPAPKPKATPKAKPDAKAKPVASKPAPAKKAAVAKPAAASRKNKAKA